MPVCQGLIEALTDVLRPLGHISVRKMFGSVALYCDGHVFALISDVVLHLKVDADTRPAFEAEGCGPFTYSTKKGVKDLGSYYRAPDRLLDDDDDLRAWARTAIDVSRRLATAKPAKKAKPKARAR